MNKIWLTMGALLMALPFSLMADHFNLYAGRPQSLTISGLKAEATYRWELRTAHDRLLADGQLPADDKGKVGMTLEIPAIEDGTTIDTKLRLVLSDGKPVTHELIFHSAKVFGDVRNAIIKAGVYTNSDAIRHSLGLAGIKSADRDQSRIFLLEDVSRKEIDELVANDKMVVIFVDGDNEFLPSRENLSRFSMEVVPGMEKPPLLSVVYNRSSFVIAYEGNGGIVDLTYRKGRLVVVAPQLRQNLDKNPETWLILKRKIMEGTK